MSIPSNSSKAAASPEPSNRSIDDVKTPENRYNKRLHKLVTEKIALKEEVQEPTRGFTKGKYKSKKTAKDTITQEATELLNKKTAVKVDESEFKVPSTPTREKQQIKQIVTENKTPEKTYSLQADKDGWISLPLTPRAKEAEHVIYMFRNKLDKKEVLIGKTEDKVGKRVPGYISAFNHPETDKGKMLLPQAVRNNPNNFEFGILCKAPNNVDLGALETAYIDMKKSMETGFNKRLGGGGAHKSKRKQDLTPERVESAKRRILTQFISPQNKKPITKTKKGGYKVELSPKSKKTKNVIYVFKNNVTGKRYIGKTIRELGKRIPEHLHYAKNEQKDTGKAPHLKDIREDHTQFSVGILYTAPSEEEDLLKEIESAFIQHYNSRKSGYNRQK